MFSKLVLLALAVSYVTAAPTNGTNSTSPPPLGNFTLLPDGTLNIFSVLNANLALLNAAQKKAFTKQQAELKRRFSAYAGTADQLASTFKPSNRTYPPSKPANSTAPKSKRALPRYCVPLTGDVPDVIKKKNYSTCLYETDTVNIDDPVVGLQTVSTNGWASGHIPPSLRGTFYMEGNPLPSLCLSTATSFWNQTAQMWELPSWQPRGWTSSPDLFGRYYEQESFRSAAINFRLACADGQLSTSNETGLATNGTVCKILQYSSKNQDTTGLGDYWTVEVADNYHIRATTNKPLLSFDSNKRDNYYYNFWRIVDDQGKRTEFYYTRYLNTTNKFSGYQGQQNVHLGNTQYVALRQ